MPKVEAIISQCSKKAPKVLPEISQVFESDPERILDALKERGGDPDYYAYLRILLSKVLRALRPKNSRQYLNPLLEINAKELTGDMQAEARLQICEGIIEAEDLYRTTAVSKHISDLSELKLNNDQQARLEIVSAGNNFLKGDYVKAAWELLSAARMEAFVREEAKRIDLVERAIAFAFIAPIGADTHRIICALCLNETVKKSGLFTFLSKLYREDIITKADVEVIQKRIPRVLCQKDIDGVSIIEQAAFSRNMIPIINCFSSIKLPTLLRLSGVGSLDQLLVLLEKTYSSGEVSVDQMHEVVHIHQGQGDSSDLIKDFLGQIDSVLAD